MIRSVVCILAVVLTTSVVTRAEPPRPNILIAISDDQSWPHASAYGSRSTKTPAFDRVAREGVLCNNAFVAYPSCSPSRAALLTGRYPWQLEHAGNFSSTFPTKFLVYPDILEDAGYWIGYTGKGWGPGDWRGTGRLRNPAGTQYNHHQMPSPPGINGNDYTRNFRKFLDKRPDGKPFVFWFGSTEPHRRYDEGIGRRQGKRLEHVSVLAFLPDDPIVRSDILDYSVEVEWFDKHLGRMLDMLRKGGELDNTLVIVTSDNGMPFPRAKANDYEFGLHVPLAIMWTKRIPGGRKIDDMISLVDLAPTFLAAASVEHPGPHAMSGRSFLDVLQSNKQGLVDKSRTAIIAGRERHGSARYRNHGYPQRAIRTLDYLYVRNYESDSWPAGQPQDYNFDGTLREMHQAYFDIDASPSKSLLVDRRHDADIKPFFQLATAKRPVQELYDIRRDPACVKNLADNAQHAKVKHELRKRLDALLTETGDARLTGASDIFRTYKRVVRGHRFPDPNDADPQPIEAIKPPVRERKGGELPRGRKAGVPVIVEVLAGDQEFSGTISLEVPEVLLGHKSFMLVRLDNMDDIMLRELRGPKTSRHVAWTLDEPLKAGCSRRFRLTPIDTPAAKPLEPERGPVNERTNGPPWVYIIHGKR